MGRAVRDETGHAQYAMAGRTSRVAHCSASELAVGKGAGEAGACLCAAALRGVDCAGEAAGEAIGESCWGVLIEKVLPRARVPASHGSACRRLNAELDGCGPGWAAASAVLPL